MLASPGEGAGRERWAEMGQVGCPAACFHPPRRGDAEPSAGGGNAIKRPGGFGGDVLAGSSLSGDPPGLNRLFLPYSKSPSCSPCCTRASSSPKQTTGETSTRPRTAAGKAGSQPFPSPRPVAPRLCCLCFSPTGPRASKGRRHQGSRHPRQDLVAGFADLSWGGRSSLQGLAVLLWSWLPTGIQQPPRAALCLLPGGPFAAPSILA